MKDLQIGRGTRPSIRKSLVRITWGGCLALVFSTGISCPAVTKFFLTIGANEFHFGLLGGIPMVLVVMQFVGAVLTNRISRRKPPWMVFLIVGRLMYLPVALLPVLFPQYCGGAMVMFLILLIALGNGLFQTGSPMWFAWMADLIPKGVLNRYWGNRQKWMQLTWVGAYLAVALFTYKSPWSITTTFAIITIVGVTAGVVDITLFTPIREPQNIRMAVDSVWAIIMAPIRDKQYRVFLITSCIRSGAIMLGAPFMQVYVFEELGFSVLSATLVWCAGGLGIAFAAGYWGRIADMHGNRPVLNICVFFKPAITLIFALLAPGRWTPWILALVFFVDGFWNAGNMVADNGYMMKMAPRKNRSMFIAAISGLTGIVGGVVAIIGGWYLKETAGFEYQALGCSWNNYQVLFLTSTGLRIIAALFTRRVREPESTRSAHVITEILGTSLIRFLRFPAGIFNQRYPE